MEPERPHGRNGGAATVCLLAGAVDDFMSAQGEARISADQTPDCSPVERQPIHGNADPVQVPVPSLYDVTEPNRIAVTVAQRRLDPPIPNE